MAIALQAYPQGTRVSRPVRVSFCHSDHAEITLRSRADPYGARQSSQKGTTEDPGDGGTFVPAGRQFGIASKGKYPCQFGLVTRRCAVERDKSE